MRVRARTWWLGTVLGSVLALVAPVLAGEAAAATGASDAAVPVWRSGIPIVTGTHELSCKPALGFCDIAVHTVAPPGSCTTETVRLPGLAPAILYAPSGCDIGISGRFTSTTLATTPPSCVLVGGLMTVTFTTGTNFPIFNAVFNASGVFLPLTIDASGFVTRAQVVFNAANAPLAGSPGGLGNVTGTSFLLNLATPLNMCAPTGSAAPVVLTPGTITIFP